MSTYQHNFRAHDPHLMQGKVLVRGLWSGIKFLAFVALLLIAGWFIFQNHFRSKLLSTLQSKVDLAVAGTGIDADIGDAQFQEGRGMLLSNVELATPGISISANETFLTMPSTMTDLVAGQVRLQAIDMRHVTVELAHDPSRPANFSDLIRRLQDTIKIQPGQQPPVPLMIRDSRLRFVDKGSGAQKTVSDINIDVLPVEHAGKTILQYKVTGKGSDLEKLMLAGFVDPDSKSWNATAELSRMRIHSGMLAALPEDVRRKLAQVRSFGALVDGTFRLQGVLGSGQLPDISGQGVIRELGFDHDRMPAILRNGYAEYRLESGGLLLSNISANLGEARFRDMTFQLENVFNPQNWECRGALDNYYHDGSQRMLSWMKDGAIRFCNDFQMAVRLDVDFYLRGSKDGLYKDVKSKVSDLSSTYVKFPYPVENGSGEFHWKGENLDYELQFPQNSRTLQIKGLLKSPGPRATWHCDMSVLKGAMPFDEKLQLAIDRQGGLGKVVRDFNGNGWVTGSAVFRKLVPDSNKVTKEFNIDLVDVSIKHKSFPYPIESIQGKIRSRDLQIVFENLQGSNGIGKIMCNGHWNPLDGLVTRCVCNNVQMDERLRAALSSQLREVWDGFRPRGTVERLVADMTIPAGTKTTNVTVEANLHSVNDGVRTSNLSIFPTCFPYELKDLAGQIKVGNGDVEIRNFQGKHGRTSVVGEGDGSYSAAGWDVRFSNMLVVALKPDSALLRALPESLAQTIEYLKFKGLLNVKGTMTLAGQYREKARNARLAAARIPNSPIDQAGQRRQGSRLTQATAQRELTIASLQPNISMGWDLSFNMNQAQMFLGIPVENVFGMFRLIGQYGDENFQCRGDLDIDSLTIYNAQITNVKGPMWFDNFQALAGGLINRLPNGQTSVPSVQGQMYGGTVQLDAAISSDKQGRFALQTRIEDADLTQICREFAPGQRDVEGKSYASLRLQGDASGAHTCRGSGSAHLRDARIYELPPIVSLFKVLRVKRADRSAFDSGDIDFTINGETIDLNRMEFNGDAISLIGNGQTNTSHDLNLNFYSVVGRNRLKIPLLSELYHRGSQKFLWIKVRGNAKDPQMTTEVLPELNDSIRQLYGENASPVLN